MTDRIKGFYVSLTHDIRDDDCEPILDAVKMIKGVAAVKPMVSGHEDWMARQHVKEELRGKVYELLDSL